MSPRGRPRRESEGRASRVPIIPPVATPFGGERGKPRGSVLSAIRDVTPWTQRGEMSRTREARPRRLSLFIPASICLHLHPQFVGDEGDAVAALLNDLGGGLAGPVAGPGFDSDEHRFVAGLHRL